MPFLLAALLLLLPIALALMMPFILVQRYRAGSQRRLARPWLATLNLVVMTASAIFFLATAALTSFWVPDALRAAAIGLAAGGVLGVMGLWASRWEPTASSLHYTPNRWLVLIVTLAVTVRVIYGFWRAATMLRADPSQSFVTAFGVAESLGVAAIVIGYYLAYAAGLRRRIRIWEKRPLRVMR